MSTPERMAEQKKILVILLSKGVSDKQQAVAQERALTLMMATKTPYQVVDGMDQNQRQRRNELFGISGIRANYPQFFFLHKDGSSHFIGNWSEIENVNETSNLPKDILEANPHILTWDKVFGNVVDSFS